MEKEKKRQKKTTDLLAALCFAVALALLLTSAGATLAKFTRRESSQGVAVAAPFYFASAELDGSYRQIDEPREDTVALTFSVRNFVDSKRRTTEDIQYRYYAVAGADPSAAPLTGTLVEKQTLSGETEDPVEKTVTVPRSAFDETGQVTVVAQATAPYTKTLTASYGFTAVEYALQWELEEQDNAVILRFSGGDGTPVTVAWPESLTPDLSNGLFSGELQGSVTFTAGNGGRYALTFLKTNPALEYGAVKTEDGENAFEIQEIS